MREKKMKARTGGGGRDDTSDHRLLSRSWKVEVCKKKQKIMLAIMRSTGDRETGGPSHFELSCGVSELLLSVFAMKKRVPAVLFTRVYHTRCAGIVRRASILFSYISSGLIDYNGTHLILYHALTGSSPGCLVWSMPQPSNYVLSRYPSL